MPDTIQDELPNPTTWPWLAVRESLEAERRAKPANQQHYALEQIEFHRSIHREPRKNWYRPDPRPPSFGDEIARLLERWFGL